MIIARLIRIMDQKGFKINKSFKLLIKKLQNSYKKLFIKKTFKLTN